MKEEKSILSENFFNHNEITNDDTLSLRVNFNTAHSYESWHKAGARNGDWFYFPSNFGAHWALRSMNISRCGFPIITAEILDVLARLLIGKRVADIGCGTGYLTYHLRQRGVNITGIDAHVEDNHYFPRLETQFLSLVAKLIINIDYREINMDNYDVFIISWPDYRGETIETLLLNIPVGKIIIYQGEGYGGCCATDNFFEILREDFVVLQEMTQALRQYNLQFSGIHDDWTVYKKHRRTFESE